MVFAVTKCTKELYKEIVEQDCNVLSYVHGVMNRTILPLHFTIELISGKPHIGTSYSDMFQYAKVLDKETFLRYYYDFMLEIRAVLSYDNSKTYAIKQLITEIKNI